MGEGEDPNVLMETPLPRASLGQFRTPKASLGDIDADIAARLISAAADVALVIDQGGAIRDVAVSGELAAEDFQAWIGRQFIDTVTVESRAKVEELLREAEQGSPPRWRQVNHPSTRSGPDIPVRYSALASGRKGRIILLGRDLGAMAALQQRLVEAQLSMEREYSRLRHAETRYRLLFHLASEAVLIVDAASNRITEANPAAGRILGKASQATVGGAVFDLFDAESAQTVQAILSKARASGRSDGERAHLAKGGAAVEVAASMFRQENGPLFLVRISTLGGATDRMEARRAEERLSKLVGDLPDGFVVTGLDRRILTANQAFLDLAQVGGSEQATGEPLDRWLGRSSADFNVLVANLKEHGAVRNFPTVLRGQFGSLEDVEVTAVSATQGEQPCLGFVLRPQGRRPTPEPRSTRQLPRSIEQLTELIGRVPLKDLVRDTTDVIERLCIEAALELTGDNRASAAQMLGLSRQSLYVKLRRYGLASAEAAEEAEG